jgi:MSHA biogenesis protein MshL
MTKLFRILIVFTSIISAGCANTRAPISGVVSIDDVKTKATEEDISAYNIEVPALSKSAFVLRSTDEQIDEIPKIKINNLSINEASVFDAMEMVAEKAGLSLSIAGSTKSLEKYGAITVRNMSGTLESVLNRLASRFGFFWTIDGGSLNIDHERRFLVELPPVLVDDSLSGIVNTLQSLGVKEPVLDRSSRTLSFKSEAKAMADVEKYLKTIRESRSMISYEISVLQVDLSDGARNGVDWRNFAASTKSFGSAVSATLINPVATASTGLSLLLEKNALSVQSVIQFLETQGTVKTVTQPRISIMSGGRGRVFVGNQTTYVSKVGSNIGQGINTVSTETKELQTGVDMTISSDVHDGTIYTQLALDISDIVSLNTFQASGVELKLPNTTKRQIENLGRSKSGETLLIAGISVNRDSLNTSQGLAGFGRISDKSQSELVIAIKPTLISFIAPTK